MDPAEQTPWAAWREAAWGSTDEVFDRMVLAGRTKQVVYEMVGRDGMLAEVIEQCEIGARILSCGGGGEDRIQTTTAHMKGVNIQIGGGPQPDDWYDCLDLVIAGSLDPMPLVGETVPLERLAEAIDRARSADAPVRILYVADP